MSIGKSFTRFVLEEEPKEAFWKTFESRLRQFAFRSIENTAEEQSYGWVCYDDPLDTEWTAISPQKGEFVVFSLRIDTRKVPGSIMKTQYQKALREEQEKLAEQGKNFISRKRKKELKEQVTFRFRSQTLPTPALFHVIWSLDTKVLYFTSTNLKKCDLFKTLFAQTFELELIPVTPLCPATLEASHDGNILQSIHKNAFKELSGEDRESLGSDFLRWLWFHSESCRGRFALENKKEDVFIYLEQHLSMEGGEEKSRETVTMQGKDSLFLEGRYALRRGNRMTLAQLRFEQDGFVYVMKLDAQLFTASGVKLPRTESSQAIPVVSDAASDGDEQEKQDACFLDEMYFLEKVFGLVDEAYRQFLAERLSPSWKDTLRNITAWVARDIM